MSIREYRDLKERIAEIDRFRDGLNKAMDRQPEHKLMVEGKVHVDATWPGQTYRQQRAAPGFDAFIARHLKAHATDLLSAYRAEVVATAAEAKAKADAEALSLLKEGAPE